MNRFAIFLLVGLALSACEHPGETLKIKELPSQYTQKALLEYFNAAWCLFSPDGEVYAQRMLDSFGTDDFNFIVYHNGDKMAYPTAKAVDYKFSAGYPTGFINRIGGRAASRGAWWQQAENVLYYKSPTYANCGLAIDASNVSGETLDLKVEVGFGQEEMPEGVYHLTVLLVDKEMSGEGTGWDQVNYYHTQPGHPYYGAGDPIVGYKHPNVVIDALTDPLGNFIAHDLIEPMTKLTYSFSKDISQFDDDLFVVAFINEYSTVRNSSFIFNAQYVDVGKKVGFE